MSDTTWISLYGSCYRHRNLVYAKSFGSEDRYWVNLFVSLGWTQVSFNNIDWDNDRVFSFIIDPVKRRTRGVVNCLMENNYLNLLNDNGFCNFLKWLPAIDINSLSYHDIWHDYCDKIKWFPADLPNVDSFSLLENYAQEFNSQKLSRANLLTAYNNPWLLEASLEDHSLKHDVNEFRSEEKQELFKKITELFGDGVHYTWQYLSKDIELYEDTCKPFI